jgi:hypothetical protein
MLHQKRFLIAVLLVLCVWAARGLIRRPADHRIDAEVAGLSQKYSLSIVASSPRFPVRISSGEINGREAARSDVASYLPILESEWDLYPAALIEKTRLRRIILCDGLAFAGQRRTAVPDFENNDLYFDVARGRDSELYTRSVIHHEFFHIIDYRDDGEVYGDARWAALNTSGFKYGTGGVNAQNDPTVSLNNNDVPGFFNRYSTTGVEEDKAEIFATMVVSRRLLDARARIDPVLHEKMQRMQELLQSFCAEMDASFWDAAGRVPRPDD